MTAQSVRLTNVDIDNAFENGHLDVVFQPVVRLSDRHILRHEVFVRWDHPGLGALPPGAFISFFEAQGRIGDLTRYVLTQAISAYSAARADMSGGLSINLSTADLSDPVLGDSVRDALKGSDLSAENLVLECPTLESDVPLSEQLERYEAVKDIGCPLSLEIRTRTIPDILREETFPFAEIKTSGSHILRYARSSRGGPGLAAIADLVSFARTQNIRTVAVGVEDEAAAIALEKVGFDAGQGKALGRAASIQGAAEDAKHAPPSDEVGKKTNEGEATPPLKRAVDEGAELARRAAARKKEQRRFDAAVPAHALQQRLQTQFDAKEDITDAVPQKLPTATETEAPQEAVVPEYIRLLKELPAEFISRASAQPNLTLDPTADEIRDDVGDEIAPLEKSDEPQTKDAPLIKEEVRFVVAEPNKAIRMPRMLRKKYRITHFWPHSWKRAWRRARAEKTEHP